MQEEIKTVQVVFTRNENNDISGKVTWYPEEDPVSKAKIVFISGYKREKVEAWRGPLPKDGEEWECEVIRDTRPDDLKKGALIVHPIVRLTPTAYIKETGQEVLGARRSAHVTVIGRREIVVSDYRAVNATTKQGRDAFIARCNELAMPIVKALVASKSTDVEACGVQVDDISIENNVMTYRVDNIRIVRKASEVFEDLVRGETITHGSFNRLVSILGPPKIAGSIVLFKTAAGDYTFLCGLDAFDSSCPIDIVRVYLDDGRPMVALEVMTPWGFPIKRTEYATDVIESSVISEAVKSAIKYQLTLL